jgi:hypothetical protein
MVGHTSFIPTHTHTHTHTHTSPPKLLGIIKLILGPRSNRSISIFSVGLTPPFLKRGLTIYSILPTSWRINT